MENMKIFIGSSSEGLVYAEALQCLLEFDMEPTVWSQDVFRSGQIVIDSLLKALGNFNLAVFIFTPDDLLKSRNISNAVVRDNVLFELGLFMGKIGKESVFFVQPRNCSLKIPTDLLGITPITFNGDREDGNIKAALGPVASEIKRISTEIMKIKNEQRIEDKKQMEKVSILSNPSICSEQNFYSLTDMNQIQRIITKLKDTKDIGLLYIDIDRLGTICNVYGIDTANIIIDSIEEIIHSIKVFGGKPFAARLYGDSFVITSKPEILENVAIKVIDSIKNYNWSKKLRTVSISCSIGLSVRKENEHEISWILRAMHSCRNAKIEGGNQVANEVEVLPKRMRLKTRINVLSLFS